MQLMCANLAFCLIFVDHWVFFIYLKVVLRNSILERLLTQLLLILFFILILQLLLFLLSRTTPLLFCIVFLIGFFISLALNVH